MRMEFVLIGLGVAAWVWLKNQSDEATRRDRAEKGAYRPGDTHGDGVHFRDADRTGRNEAAPRDAFTAEDLDPERQIFQCQSCRVWYHADTVNALRRENQGACVMCGNSDLLRDRVTEDRLRHAKR